MSYIIVRDVLDFDNRLIVVYLQLLIKKDGGTGPCDILATLANLVLIPFLELYPDEDEEDYSKLFLDN